MKKIIQEWSEKFKKLNYREFTTWIDKVSFLHISFVWATTIFCFGLSYFFLQNNNNYLLHSISQYKAANLFDCIYFSFVTATSTGFGDIVPIGTFKLVSVIEVVFGLLMFAIVTSKIISQKQNIIIEEIYDISFSEKVSRIRSSLLLFRQHLRRLIEKIEEERYKKREISDLYVEFGNLDAQLFEIERLSNKKQSLFRKTLDNLDAEILLHNVSKSFERCYDLLHCLNQHSINWDYDVTLKLLQRTIKRNSKIRENLSKILKGKDYEEEFNRNLEAINALENEITNKFLRPKKEQQKLI